MQDDKTTKNILVIYLIGLIFTLHAALPTYISSTFLSRFSTEKLVGIIYTISAILTILAFTQIPKFLNKYGNYKITIAVLIADFFALFGLLYFTNPILVTLAFIVSFISVAIIGFSMDVFLEKSSSDAKTGQIRGSYLTSCNIAWILSSFITSLILTDGDYWKIFLVAMLLLLPVLWLIQKNLHGFKDSEYHSVPMLSTLREIHNEKNIFDVLVVTFLLQLFYAWMVIYTPIYLYEHIGFSWQEIGIIFSIMLLPFVLIELPLGKLADTKWGEKEILCLGFLIIAVSTIMISFVTEKNLLVWAILLFITRIGASMIEIMSETYFFKKIDSSKINLIGFFRTMRPWAYVLGSILATGALIFVSFKYLFVLLGLIMLLGLYFSIKLEDTR